MRHRPSTSGNNLATSSEWPDWARTQLSSAVEFAREHAASQRGTALAGELYHEWFTPPVVETPSDLLRRPLVGLYRQAHAGTNRRVDDDGLQIIERRDAIGRDRWWRTWGAAWSPQNRRARGVRVLFSPRMDVLAGFVAITTSALLDRKEPWLLACPTLPSRLRHSGSAVLYLPNLDALPAGLLAALAPALRPDTPPLCLPLAPGAALAEQPGNGMTFGEHRCHLVALALADRDPRAMECRDPFAAIAGVFNAHGVDPARPHLGG